jgi:hypothetical protein
MSKEIAMLTKRVPRRRHFVEAARFELPRLKTPGMVLLITWLIAIVVLPH